MGSPGMLLRPSPVAGREQSLPPPPRFLRLPVGAIRNAQRSENPHAVGARSSAAQRAGLRYQRLVEGWLGAEFPPGGDAALVVSPWYQFVDGSGQRRWCQPDAIVEFPDRRLCIEIKTSWTTDAWWQLRKLYLPVLEAATQWQREAWQRGFIPLVICKHYDPAAKIPEEVKLLDHPREADARAFNILVWRSNG